jgi:hypothetical protein
MTLIVAGFFILACQPRASCSKYFLLMLVFRNDRKGYPECKKRGDGRGELKILRRNIYDVYATSFRTS